MNKEYPNGPVTRLTLCANAKMDVVSGIVIPTTQDLSGLKFDNVIESDNRADAYRIIANVLENKKGHFIYDILKYDTHLGYDAYAIANMTMNPMTRLIPGEKELIGRFMTTDCLEDEFIMDFDGDFVQILNEGLVQQILEMNEVKSNEAE